MTLTKIAGLLFLAGLVACGTTETSRLGNRSRNRPDVRGSSAWYNRSISSDSGSSRESALEGSILKDDGTQWLKAR